MTTQLIALYLGAGAAMIGIAIALFKYMKELVDKECPLDNCEHCGCETYNGECPGRCQPDSNLRIDHSVHVKRIPMWKWMRLYNKSFPAKEIKYFKAW